ncbi:MAG: hypothetical protein J6D57_14795 [Mogibacterium sp.]|nr:hypothetical protein [Mogibacterium sp.]
MANILSSSEALLLFPKEGLFIHAQEGSGDNLLREDIAEGYVDYIDWTSYRALWSYADGFEIDEADGGMAMFKEPVTQLPDEELLAALKYEAGIPDESSCITINIS